MTQEEELAFDIKPEYDFSTARPNPYAARVNAAFARPGYLVAIDPDVYSQFSDDNAVNQALRDLLQARKHSAA